MVVVGVLNRKGNLGMKYINKSNIKRLYLFDSRYLLTFFII
jgi:hypothetical protein